jgi:hypothetical protein
MKEPMTSKHSCFRCAQVARATRGRGLPSPGQMARPGKSIAKQSEGRAGEKYLPVGGRVRMLRAVGIIPPTPYKVTAR